MKKSVNIAIIGGDGRAACAAEYFYRLGYEVGYCRCQSDISSSAVRIESVSDALEFADAVLLPIPVSRDGKTLAYSEGVLLSQIINDLPKDKKMLVFGGMIPKGVKQELESRGAHVFDYGEDEKYLQESATLTAMAFFDFIKDKNFSPVENKRVAICGLGRIGKRLVLSLCRENTQILALSGNADAHKGNYPENVSFYDYKDAKTVLDGCDIVINTAPANVIDVEAVKNMPENAVFYELASAPFGIDNESTKYLGKRYVKALGLPGIYYPKESGELIAKSVLDHLGLHDDL